MKNIIFYAFCLSFLSLLAANQSVAADSQSTSPSEVAYLLYSDIDSDEHHEHTDIFLKRLDEIDTLPETPVSMYWKMSAIQQLARNLKKVGRNADAEGLLNKYKELSEALAIANKAETMNKTDDPDGALAELDKLKTTTGDKRRSTLLYLRSLSSIITTYNHKGEVKKAIDLYGIFEQEEYVNFASEINEARSSALDRLILVQASESRNDFGQALALYGRLERCKAQSACSDSAVANITESLIESMLHAKRFGDAEMLYKKILALKDNQAAGEKTATDSSDYGAKFKVSRLQQRTAKELIYQYRNESENEMVKARAVYTQLYEVLSPDPVRRSYLVDVAEMLMQDAKNADELNSIFQTLALPEKIPVPRGDQSAQLEDDRDDKPVSYDVYQARISYLHLYRLVFAGALRERNLKLAESLYQQSADWRQDNLILSIREHMKKLLTTAQELKPK